VRTLQLGSQTEGCAVDDDARHLYVGEEDVGVWRFDFHPEAGIEPLAVARVDNHRIRADVEGLALLQDGKEKYLIVSSQGDSTFPVYRIAGSRHEYVGRFTVVAGDRIDAVTETDDVSAWSGPIGRYPNGLIAMHDEEDEPHAGQQNFILVDWRDVKQALGLPSTKRGVCDSCATWRCSPCSRSDRLVLRIRWCRAELQLTSQAVSQIAS